MINCAAPPAPASSLTECCQGSCDADCCRSSEASAAGCLAASEEVKKIR